MENFHKCIIVGGGPIGLYFANKCEQIKADYLLLEGSYELGGQLIHLYPEKDVVDLKEFESIKAKDYISFLLKTIDLSHVKLDAQVLEIETGDVITLKTKDSEYKCEKLVIATGLGTSTPRPLGVEGESSVNNIIYNLNDYSFLKDKRIAIFGGGDSALDWAKQLSSISNDVHLVHRRTEFRGNPDTIKDCKNLKVHLPYVPFKLNIEEKTAKSIVIQKVETEEFVEIPVDYIFVNYGNVAKQSSFPFPMTGAFLNVNEDLEIEKNIFAIGDVAAYQNKTRRMEPGKKEADKVFETIFR